jgi:transposase-like protein
MDTSTIKAAIDTLGRRVPRRRHRSVEEKIKIVTETRVAGASVAEVARRHGVNANQVFSWRQQHEQGALVKRSRRGAVKLLSVQVSGESGEKCVPLQSSMPTASEERLEIALPEGIRIAIFGAFALDRLAQVLSILRRRPS